MISQKYAKELFDYNENTGDLIRKSSKGSSKKGDTVDSKNSHGYLRVGINGKRYLAHKVIWIWWYGYETENYVDHINKTKDDNRILNLREVTRSCNAINTNVRVTNKSNVTGVYWNGNKNKWNAYIDKNRNRHHLGTFSNKSVAVMARWIAERSLKSDLCNPDSSAYLYLKNEILERSCKSL